MNLLLFSDIHHDLDGAQRLVDRAHRPDVDVVIGAGDFAVVHRGLPETIAVLRSIEKPTVLVPGNNETEDALRDACEGWDSATVLHGAGVEIEGRSFFGLGGGVPPTPWDWSFDVTEADAARMLAACPDGGILVLHSPPHGHLDGEKKLGSPALLDAITAHHPRLVVCGHIHECWGQESAIDETLVVNPGPKGRVVEIS